MAKSLKENMPEKVTKEDKKYIEKYGEKLSKSTQYSKWINSIEDHEEHKGQSLVTRNHDVIKKWAEERGAAPATVPGTRHGDDLGVLRFDFPGFGGRELEHVDWEEWLKTFDNRDLAFIFQEHQKKGNQSNFFRLDNPHREDG
jgi:hypothetical protein